jgi:type IV pilus assembly protein PilO
MEISLAKLPWYGQVGAFMALALAAVAVFHFYYEVPLGADMAARESELASLGRDINKGVTTAQQMPEFRAEIGDLERRLSDLRAVLPEEKDLAELLRRLQADAVQSNLTIKGIRPTPVVTKQLHAEWSIELELEGSYHNLAAFFDRLGRFTRIVNVTGLEVRSKDNPEPNVTITARCIATTFVLLAPSGANQPPRASAAPAAKAT